MHVLLTGIEKVAKTALEGEAVGQTGKAFDNLSDRRIDGGQVNLMKGDLPLFMKVWIFNKRAGFSESLHGSFKNRN